MHKLLFVGGLHRSGTSILFKLLGTSPQISKHADTGVPEDEGQHIQTVYPSAKKYGGPGLFCFADEYHYTENNILVTDKNKEKLFVEWSNYWDLNKNILIEKSPPNIIHMRFLQALFPGSYFIIILRHPVSVSRATSKWNKKLSLENLLDHWIKALTILYADAPYIKNLLIIKYEDFCTNPQNVISKIEILLGVKLDIDFKKFDIIDYNDKYLQDPIDEIIIDKYEEAVNKFDYSLKLN